MDGGSTRSTTGRTRQEHTERSMPVRANGRRRPLLSDSGGRTERSVVCALPQHGLTECSEVFLIFDDRREVIASELTGLRCEVHVAVSQEQLCFADTLWVQQQLTWMGIRGCILWADPQIEGYFESNTEAVVAHAECDHLGIVDSSSTGTPSATVTGRAGRRA